MANGVVFASAGVGMVLMPMTYNAGLKYLGLNGALLINGAMSMAAMVLICIFYPTKNGILETQGNI